MMMMYNIIKLFIYLFALIYIALVLAPIMILTTIISQLIIFWKKL
jgi:hypothetical protein